MKKKPGRMQQRTRQKQKMSRRTVVIIAAASMTCMVLGLTVFFNMTRVDDTLANQNNNAVQMYIIEEQDFTVEKTVPQPFIKQMPVIDENTQLVRTTKQASAVSNNVHN